jgi:polar amino acid transport system ATP-binding protein
MNAISNVMLAPRRVHKKTRAQLLEEVTGLFERFGLNDQMYKYPDQLSGGQQQRVAIVRALAMKPEVMLLDEITSALDPQLVGEVLEVLFTLKDEGMTILMATHEMNFAKKAADKICFLKNGRVLEEGAPDRIFGPDATEETKSFLSSF